MSQYKDPIYENVVVGETFGPQALVLDDYFIKSYAYATDDYSALEIVDGAVRAQGLVPGAAIVANLMQIFLTVYNPDTVVGLHQKEQVEHFKHVPVGATLTMTGRYIEKYQKRGKGYVVLLSEAHDEAGDLVCRQHSTEIMRMPENVVVGTGAATPERRISPRPLDAERVGRVTSATPSGVAIATLTKTVRQAQMSVFTGAEIHKLGIHTVRSIALAAGLRDCIAQGMMESCWASEFLTRAFGDVFLANGRHETVYLTPVYARDVIRVEGVLTGLDAEGRTEIEFWLTNQHGETTAVGFGSALL